MARKRSYDTLIGGSVGWNQLCNDSSVTVQNGHKYYMSKGGAKSIAASTGAAITGLTSGTDMVIDLTLLLGSTIADYVYSLETATSGAGIAKLREWGFDLDTYHAYDAGSIKSVEVTEKKVVGFNQWNEEWEVGGISYITGEKDNATNRIRSKNYIPVIGSKTYFIKNFGVIAHFDADKNYLGNVSYRTVSGGYLLDMSADTRYILFSMIPSYGTTYKNDICINISSDRNGEYEAYTEQTYDYGTDTLNGIFKLDASNNLYADGDVKTSDGVITRHYGTRDYQSGDESLPDAITDGTTTVYKLTTPTTEQSDPFPSPQVCYPDGTEEYVTSNGVPVGHETRYQL